jgi:nucleoside-diphosphate-sugar epimerase
VNELYEVLVGLSGKASPLEHGPTKPGEQLHSSLDPSLVADTLGWRPDVDLTAGLTKTLRFFGAL